MRPRIFTLGVLLALGGCVPRRLSGAQCVFDMDCASGLLCSANACRAVCSSNGDCATLGSNFTCQRDPVSSASVCLAPADPRPCRYASDCTGTAVCGPGGVCQPVCQADRDCPVGPTGPWTCDRTARLCVAPTVVVPDAAPPDVWPAPTVVPLTAAQGATVELPGIRVRIPPWADLANGFPASATLTVARYPIPADALSPADPSAAGWKVDLSAPTLTDIVCESGDHLPRLEVQLLAPATSGDAGARNYNITRFGAGAYTQSNADYDSATGWLTSFVARGGIFYVGTSPTRASTPHIVQLQATGNSVFALSDEGRIFQWGAQAYAQRGMGTSDLPTPTARVLPHREVIEFAAAPAALLARHADGRWTLWQPGSALSATPLTVDTLADLHALRGRGEALSYVSGKTSALSGNMLFCGLFRDTFACVGTDTFSGLRATPRFEPTIPVPTSPLQLSPVSGVVPNLRAPALFNASPFHVCAAAQGASPVTCWGRSDLNQSGALGDPMMGYAVVPTLLGGPLTGRGARLLASGDDFSCVATAPSAGGNADQLHCWGHNDAFRLGVMGDGMSTPTPTAIAGPSGNITALTAGAAHACAVYSSATDQLVCWGNNTAGEAGSAGLGNGVAPTALTLPMGLTSIRSLVAAERFTCLLAADQTVWCWGANNFGQLGQGDTMPPSTPGSPLLVHLQR